MASRRSKEALIRQWSLVEHLSRRQRGLSVEHMRGHTSANRSTVYLGLGVLCEAGVPIESESINGEPRYRLCSKALPPLGPTALQISALRLAVDVLALDGHSGFAERAEIAVQGRAARARMAAHLIDADAALRARQLLDERPLPDQRFSRATRRHLPPCRASEIT